MVYNAEQMQGKMMKRMMILLFLCGCDGKTPMQNATDSALQQLDAIEHSIKPECKSASTDKQIDALRTTIKSQLSTCELEVERITADKKRWQTISVMLLIIITFYIGRKIL